MVGQDPDGETALALPRSHFLPAVRAHRLGSQVEMMKGFKKQAVRTDRWEKMSPAEREGRFPIGVLADHGHPTFWETYEGAIQRAQATRKEG